MSNTTFTDNSTIIVAAFMNDVNDTVYDVLGDGTNVPATKADARTNLGLGTMATQNANNVTITGGSVSGVTFPGLGSMATQNASAVAITGGTISGIASLANSGANSNITSLSGLTTPLSVAQGGTGDALGSASALIQRQTASGAVASIDFTSIANSTYNDYEILLEGILPTTNSVNLLLQFQMAGSWVTSGYYWANWRWTTAGSGAAGQAGTGTGIALTPAGADNMANTGDPAAFWIKITNCAQATRAKRVSYEAAFTGSAPLNVKGNGVSSGTGAVTGFRIVMDTGTIQTGAVATLRGFR